MSIFLNYKPKNVIFSFFILVLFFSYNKVRGQHFNAGIVPIDNYSPRDYKASEENWDIAYGTDGVVYFANGFGLLKYDGNSWELYQMPNKSPVRSILIYGNKIFVGATNELGYFIHDHIGRLKYISLRDSIKKERRDLGPVWKIHRLKNKVVFQTADRLFIYENNIISKVNCQIEIRSSFSIKDKLIVFDKRMGMCQLKDNSLDSLPGGSSYINSEVNVCLSMEADTILIHTPTAGFFKYIDGKSYLLESSDLKTIHNDYPFSGAKTDDGNYIIGTTNKGIYLITSSGKIIEHINRPKGLVGDKIFGIKPDKFFNCWVALENGISYIHLGSQFKFIDHRSGLEATGLSVIKTNDQVFVGTSYAVFRYNEERNDFSKVPGTEGPTYCFMEAGDLIVVGNLFGVYLLDKKTYTISDYHKIGTVRSFRKNGSGKFILTAGENGIYVLEMEKGRLRLKNQLAPFDEPIEHIEIAEDNTVWVSNQFRGIWKLKPRPDYKKLVRIKQYGARNGLPENFFNSVTKIDGNLYFGTQKGLYVYDEDQDRFRITKKFNKIIGPNYVQYINVDNSHEVWYSTVSESDDGHSLSTSVGRFDLLNLATAEGHSIPFRKFKEFRLNFVVPISKYKILLGSSDGCLLYNTRAKKDYLRPFSAHITSVIKDENEVLYVLGAQKNAFGSRLDSLGEPDPPILPFEKSLLTFMYSHDYTEEVSNSRFQYKLEGLDQEWSPWSKEHVRQYSNLPSGKYVFHVRARNVYGVVSQESTFAFKVQLPWYQTFWAYTIEISFVLTLLLVSIYVGRNKRNSRWSVFIILLTIITIFEAGAQIIENYLDTYGGGVFILKVVVNIILALSIGPLEYRIRQRQLKK